jgi:hypothetical protein
LDLGGSLPENTAERQPRFPRTPCPKNFYKNYMSAKIGAVGSGLFLAI